MEPCARSSLKMFPNQYVCKILMFMNTGVSFLLQVHWFPPTVGWTGESKLPAGMNEASALNVMSESL